MELPNVVELAIPFFILAVLLEMIIGRARGTARFETRDTMASLLMGFGNTILGIFYGMATIGLFYWVYDHRIFELGTHWGVFVFALIAKDFVYYWFHRWSHEVRWFWAAHVVHHTSQHYNLSTALRQTWSGLFTGLFVLALPFIWLGVPPGVYFFAGGINLVYQFWIHTETIDRMGPFEWIFNTPSHHRVHHATNPRYIDRNYAGMLIIWDRMFGTFVEETREEAPHYGVIRNIATFNPLKIATHEYISIFKDWVRCRSFSDFLNYTFGPPGWSTDGSRQTSADIKREWLEAAKEHVGEGLLPEANPAE